jgi:hypothetical protein
VVTSVLRPTISGTERAYRAAPRPLGRVNPGNSGCVKGDFGEEWG